MAGNRDTRSGALRIFDANLNRANEAARVVEDFARFVLDHPGLANAAKSLRHRIQTAAARAIRRTTSAPNSPARTRRNARAHRSSCARISSGSSRR